MFKKIYIALLFVFSCLCFNTIFAQQDSSANIIISTVKFNTKRSQIPLAIGKVSQKELQTLQPLQWGDVLNRVSGVQYINLGNEQHAFAIRQPISFKSYFGFLEDGVAIRPSGLFNNNALLEIHNGDLNNIEIIKGTASAFYGNEAIGGVVNYNTNNTTNNNYNTIGRLSFTSTQIAKADLYKSIKICTNQSLQLSGSLAQRRNGSFEHYDFDKQSVALTHNIVFSNNAQLQTRLVYVYFKSDMIDSKDSIAYVKKDYTSKHSFTNREVNALRATSTLTITEGNTIIKPYIGFRKNNTTQNPSYLIVEDVWFGGSPLKAKGEINVQKFTSYIAGINTKTQVHNTQFLYGASIDVSPSSLNRNITLINKDAVGNYLNFTPTNNYLARNSTDVSTASAYGQVNHSFTNKLILNAGLRYDNIHYYYQNLGSTTTEPFSFKAWSPRLGLVYNNNGTGVYANVGKGFTPPQISDIFGSATPVNLKTANFVNYELGSWHYIKNLNAYIELNAYHLRGLNEIVYSLRNNVLQTANAGETTHTGLEYTLRYQSKTAWQLLFSGSVAKHKYIKYQDVTGGYPIENLVFDGKEMPWAARNSFVFSVGKQIKLQNNMLQLMVDVNRTGKSYLDDFNTLTYNGHTLINTRANFTFKKNVQLFVHAYNIFNTHHAVLAYKGKYGFGYNIGELRTFNMGVQVQL
jgi:iron complex outermembrane recepter protein